MENSQKLELLDLSAAVTVLSSIIERFGGQQLLTNSEIQVLGFSQNVHETRRKELLEAFGIVEEKVPAGRGDVAGEPVPESREGTNSPWP